MPQFAETGHLLTVGVVQCALGLAVAALLFGLYRLGRDRYLVYWAAAWLLLSAISALTALALLAGTGSGLGLLLGLLTALLLYAQPTALVLAAISLAGAQPSRARHWAIVGGALFCGLALILLAQSAVVPQPRLRTAVTVSPSYLLRVIANGWFAWAFARHSSRAGSAAGRLVVGFSVLYAAHLLVVGLGWAGLELYRSASVSAVIGLLLPIGITAGLVLSVLQDTARSAARQRESEATNRGLLAAIPDMLVVLDRDGVYRDLRPAKDFPPLAPPEQFLGKRGEEFLPADLARAQRLHLARALETGETQAFEYSLALPSGSQHFEARLAVSGGDRVIGIVRDVTARKSVEQEREALIAELAAEKERLAVTLRSIGDGVIATDVDGRIASINREAEQLTGWPADQAIGRSLSEVLHLVDRDTREPGPDPLAAVLSRGCVLQLPDSSLLVRKDGSETQVADSAAPIYDRNSRIVGVVVVFRDVTERRRLEQQLQNAQKLESLGVLAGGIAHDFNNLLTGVFGFVDLALERAPADPSVRGPLEKVLAVLARARGLTAQLLTFTHAGQPVKAPLDLAALLRAGARFALSGSNVTCEVEVPDELWSCDGDRQQIDQVVDNLLLNARQAMPEGGLVQISAGNLRVPEDRALPVEAGRYVRFTVRDHGEGVPPELITRIFEPFFTTKSTGSGLGLAMAHSIVRKHDGHLEVASEPGKGAAFSVYLPASSASPSPASPAAERAGGGHGRLLVLEDEDYVREVVTAMLETLGYAVEPCADGRAACEACRRAKLASQPFDLAILDLTVPGGLGGLAVAPHLHEIDPGLPLVATSGYSGDPVMANPRHYGFVSMLTKPYTLSEVAEVVARARRQTTARG